jgi:hypothetical protein
MIVYHKMVAIEGKDDHFPVHWAQKLHVEKPVIDIQKHSDSQQPAPAPKNSPSIVIETYS